MCMSRSDEEHICGHLSDEDSGNNNRQLKWVCEQLNIFIIMCKHMFIPAQNQQCNVEAKLC